MSKAHDSHSAAKSWDDATPEEILAARVQSLEEGLEHLKLCVEEALRACLSHPSRGARPETILDDEWSK